MRAAGRFASAEVQARLRRFSLWVAICFLVIGVMTCFLLKSVAGLVDSLTAYKQSTNDLYTFQR